VGNNFIPVPEHKAIEAAHPGFPNGNPGFPPPPKSNRKEGGIVGALHPWRGINSGESKQAAGSGRREEFGPPSGSRLPAANSDRAD